MVFYSWLQHLIHFYWLISIDIETSDWETPLISQKLYAQKLFNLWQKTLTIVADSKKSVYITSAILHTDQLTLIIKYISFEDDLLSEIFFYIFLELKTHSRKNIVDLTLSYFTELKLSLENVESNKFARFISCADHALNSMGR